MVGNRECNTERGFKNQLYIELGIRLYLVFSNFWGKNGNSDHTETVRRVRNDEMTSSFPLSLCTWFSNFGFRSLFQTRKKNRFRNSIFFRVRTWFLQATQAVEIKFKLEKKSSWFWTQFFSKLEINSEIQNSKIEYREIGRLTKCFLILIYLKIGWKRHNKDCALKRKSIKVQT